MATELYNRDTPGRPMEEVVAVLKAQDDAFPETVGDRMAHAKVIAAELFF